MKVELLKTATDFGLELRNSNGNSCLIDASADIGGTGREFRPMELLAGSVAACMAIDLLGILKKQRTLVKDFRILIDAERVDAVPAPFESIQLLILVDAAIDTERLQRNAELVLQKYCSVTASLDPNIKITVQVKQNDENR
jgi:putative redox protein